MDDINQKIFSLDSSKYFIKFSNQNGKIFCKRSTSDEYNSCILAKDILSRYPDIKIGNNYYQIRIPQLYNYSNGILEMEFFYGDNLELLLRSKETHSQGVLYLNSILEFLISKGFNWGDFAPRNILINDNEICIVDFEKSLMNFIDNQIEYLQNHVYEEYSSFIFENERLWSIDDVFLLNETENVNISIESIKIKRCKYLCKLLYNTETISLLEYLNAWKLILKAEIPFIYNDNYIFPRIYLSKTLENKKETDTVYYDYAKEIIEISGFKSPKEKIKLLEP